MTTRVDTLAGVLKEIGDIYHNEATRESFRSGALKVLRGKSFEEQLAEIVELAESTEDRSAAAEVFIALVEDMCDTASEETIVRVFAFIADHFMDVFECDFDASTYEETYKLFRRLPLKEQAKFFRAIAWNPNIESDVHYILGPLVSTLNDHDISGLSNVINNAGDRAVNYQAFTRIMERIAG